MIKKIIIFKLVTTHKQFQANVQFNPGQKVKTDVKEINY